MKAEIVLTVAESKRLIAKGVAASDFVQEKLSRGIIVVGNGSTNAYVLEELTGEPIDKRAFISGRTLPAKGAPRWDVQRMPDVVLVNGSREPGLDRFSAIGEMQEGDIYIKGANALNYGLGVAGITIGHPVGGTIGGAAGGIIGKKLRLLIPIGLEKEICFDINEASALLAEPDECRGTVYSLWPVQGTVFTEIEALDTLSGVRAIPVAAGGLAGAEGSIRILLIGDSDAIDEALAQVNGVHGEPAII